MFKISLTNKQSNKFSLVLIITAVVILTLICIFMFVHKHKDAQSKTSLDTTESSVSDVDGFDVLNFCDGLQITSIDSYSGVYLEDGSDSVVGSIMMIVLKNVSDKDLQLARVKVYYDDFVAEFEATNIPSGESVVLLEKNRHKSVNEEYKKVSAENVVFFSEKMDCMADTFEISSGEGFVELRNISGNDISGKTYIYYKNKTAGTLYGGITYRATVEEPIAAGSNVRVLTKHFTENNTEIMQIVNVR